MKIAIGNTYRISSLCEGHYRLDPNPHGEYIHVCVIADTQYDYMLNMPTSTLYIVGNTNYNLTQRFPDIPSCNIVVIHDLPPSGQTDEVLQLIKNELEKV